MTEEKMALLELLAPLVRAVAQEAPEPLPDRISAADRPAGELRSDTISYSP